jgi:muramidase (phage lysozyme)
MTRDELVAASREPNVRALLDAIAACEGTAGPEGYQTLFGGGRFDSFTDHPRRAITASLAGKPITSTAAGRYQFLRDTWANLVKQYGFPTFAPRWQDAGAVALIVEKRALEDIRAGNLDAAVAKLATTWASLPGAPYGQPTKHASFVRDVYLRAGGRLDGGAPIEARTAPPTIGVRPAAPTESKPMAPAIAAAILSPFAKPAMDALASLIPTLADLFKGETPSKVADRNVEAFKAIADKVLPIVLSSTGAPNAQAAVEAVQADPALASKADDALRREYYELQRVSIKEARDFAVSYAQITNVRTVVGRLTFLELFTLIVVALSAVMVGGMMYLGLLTGELLGAVVTMVVVAGFVDTRKFWLGLPAPDQRSEPPK